MNLFTISNQKWVYFSVYRPSEHNNSQYSFKELKKPLVKPVNLIEISF